MDDGFPSNWGISFGSLNFLSRYSSLFLWINNQQKPIAGWWSNSLRSNHSKSSRSFSIQSSCATDLGWFGLGWGLHLRGLEMASGTLKILGILKLCDTLTGTCLKGIPILNSQGSSSEESWWWSLPHDRLQIRLELYGLNRKYPFFLIVWDERLIDKGYHLPGTWFLLKTLGFQKSPWEALQTLKPTNLPGSITSQPHRGFEAGGKPWQIQWRESEQWREYERIWNLVRFY